MQGGIEWQSRKVNITCLYTNAQIDSQTKQCLAETCQTRKIELTGLFDV